MDSLCVTRIQKPELGWDGYLSTGVKVIAFADV